MGIHRGGCAQATARQHRRPEQGVKTDDVLADEVIQLGSAAGFQVFIEVEIAAFVAQVFETGEVAHGRIEPDIEVLARRMGDFKSEIGTVAGDVPFLQTFLEPLIQFVGDFML